MEVVVARSFRHRLIGLALRREPPGHALLIPDCRSVHTFGMRFPIDLFWLDEWGWPIRVDRAVGPRRLLACRRASAVLEVPADHARGLCGILPCAGSGCHG
ncbi:MAG: DUF192 domain-containing protein [Thermoleophilaceae bacterium]